MGKRKWIAVAVTIALIAAAIAFVEFSGIKQDIANKIEEKKMWEETSAELAEHINKDAFFVNKYGKVDSWKIIEKKLDTADNGEEIFILTVSCETKSHILQIYASKQGDENWRYRPEDIRLK